MRRAKIIGTLGPNSSDVESICALIESGLNVARVNMSHGTYEHHEQTISNIRKASKKCGKEVGILLDLQGPKIRVDKLNSPLKLGKGEKWFIGASSNKAGAKKAGDKFIPTVYEKLVDDVENGCSVLFDDGLIEAQVTNKADGLLEVEIKVGGELKSNKGINLPDAQISAPSFTDKDREDLFFGLKNKVDFVALSFVRRRSCVDEVKYLLHKMKIEIPIVAKIEKPEAIKNIRGIIKAADMIMIARGDMAVEVGNHLVPRIQKKIIDLCNTQGVPVITATQMLESMIGNPRPTRAEASDVANAIWDGSDAVMLSGETAVGAYPAEAVKMMDSIISEAEQNPKERPLLRHMDLKSLSASLQVAASLMAEKTHAKWIISVTNKGNSCLKMSRFRPKTPVLGVTESLGTVRRLCLYWGVQPYLFKSSENDEKGLEYQMIDFIRKQNLVERGDKIVITTGDGRVFSRGTSNTVRIEQITDLYHPETESQGSQIDSAEFKTGRILLDQEVCASCQNCVTACPYDIWEVTKDENQTTVINQENASKCAFDMECVESCPTGAIEILQQN